MNEQYFNVKEYQKVWSVAQLTEYLPNMHKALSLIPINAYTMSGGAHLKLQYSPKLRVSQQTIQKEFSGKFLDNNYDIDQRSTGQFRT